MRSDRLAAALALAVALPACTITDPARPIVLLAEALTEDDRVNLEEAAACWNMEFGTQLVIGDAASGDQHVEVFYDKQTCLHTIAQVQTGWPHALAVCPAEYRPTMLYRELAFRVLSHELGHVLNIVGHPDDPFAVMLGGGYNSQPMFRDADREMFFDANPGFQGVPHCELRVRRWRLPNSSIGHCLCQE